MQTERKRFKQDLELPVAYGHTKHYLERFEATGDVLSMGKDLFPNSNFDDIFVQAANFQNNKGTNKQGTGTTDQLIDIKG